MAAEPAEFADAQPFSPSEFLNLPPTPPLECPALHLQDDDDDNDLMLPFISRMLMEEEELDGFLDQYHPDHPALLHAQQPFADILSGAAANSTTISSADANSNSTAADSTPAFANATWPYDPAELSQMLLSRTYPPADTSATYPSADSLASSSSTMFGGGATVSMDMLNQAFLKGMEEASKFLPATNNSLLMPVVSGDGDRNKLWPVRQPKKTVRPQVDGNGMSSSLLLQQSANTNGISRGRKNSRHAGWGDGNGLFHFGKLMDEGADIDSCPRDMVLGNIQKMRPDVFVLCTENSSYNAPFFVTRFREALFYYSAMFDMMDAVAPQDDDERVLVEQDLFGHCALNAIACEGSDRVERPETYRQWQVRNDRAGLRQLPLDPDAVKGISKKVKDKYHKDFVIDVDQQWLLQGWKGRILYAMSAWVAKDDIS